MGEVRHPAKGLAVTVPGQLGKDVPVGTIVENTVIYEKGPTSWGACVPDLRGFIAVGDSRDEVERLIRESVEFHLDGMRQEGISIPPPSSFAGVIEINSAA